MKVSADSTLRGIALNAAAAGLLGLLEERLRNIMREEIASLAEATSTTLEGWMSVGNAAAYLDLTPAALRARVARGEVKAYRLGEEGRNLRFRQSDLDSHLVEVKSVDQQRITYSKG